MRATVYFKEVGKEQSGKTVYIGENLTEEYIISFFGLNEPDVEYYNIVIE